MVGVVHALLHGGFRGQPAKAWEDYFLELEKPFVDSSDINIVLVPWANSPKQWAAIARKLAERCQAYWPLKTVTIQVAEDMQQLETYAQTADILYCPGGILLQKLIEPMQQAKPALLSSSIKVFTGFSAGAYALSNTYYNAKKKAALPGGGLFYAAVCCHYTNERAQAKSLLENKLQVEGGNEQSPHLLADGDIVWQAL
jgi:peptidase E